MTTHGIYYYAVQSVFEDHVMSAPGETVAVTGPGSVYLPPYTILEPRERSGK